MIDLLSVCNVQSIHLYVPKSNSFLPAQSPLKKKLVIKASRILAQNLCRVRPSLYPVSVSFITRFCVGEWLWCLPQAWKHAVWRNVCMRVWGHLEHQVWVLCVPLLCASLSAPPSATLRHLQRFLALRDSGHLQRIRESRERGGKERKILRWQVWSVWKGHLDDYRCVHKFQNQIAFREPDKIYLAVFHEESCNIYLSACYK